MRAIPNPLRTSVLPVLLFAGVGLLLLLSDAVGQGPPAQPPQNTSLQSKIRLATQLFQQGKDQEAEKLFIEILEQDPKQVPAYNFLGILYSRTGRYEQAIAAFQNLLAINPDYAGAYFGLGVAYKYLKDPHRALEHFRKAVALYPAYPVAWLNIAFIADALGDGEESVQAYHRVLDTADPSSDEYKQARGRLNDIGEDPDVAHRVRELMTQVNLLLKTNERASVVPLLQEAAALLPKSLTVRKMLADETARLGDYEASETARRELVQIDPADLSLRFQLGQFLVLLGRVDEALAVYRDLLGVAVNRDEKLPEVEQAKTELFRLLDQKAIQDHLSKADVLTLEAKWDQAIGELRLAQNIDPDSTLVLYNLLRLSQQAGYRDLAISTGQELLLIEPNSRDVYLLLGQAYQDQHYFFRAIASYVKVLSLSNVQQRADLPYSEAQVGIQNAIVGLKKSAPQAINNFAKSLRNKAKGNVSEAEAYLKLAFSVAPEAPLMHVHLGKLYAETGRSDQAIEELRKAVEFSPGLYVGWLDLADLYVKKNWYRTAGEIFDTLLRLPDSDIGQLGTSRADLTRRTDDTRQTWTTAHAQALALFQEGQAAFQAGDLKDSISKFLEAHYQEPDNPFILQSLGVAHAANQDGKRAAQAFRDALAIDPDYVAARFRLGLVLEASETYRAAQWEYRQLVAMPDAKNHPEYAQAQERLVKIKELRHRLHDAELHEEQGLPVVEMKEPPPGPDELMVGLWHLKRAIELNPDPGRYYYNLGLLHEKIAANKVQRERIAITTQQQNLDLHRDAIEAYQTGPRHEPAYLPLYLRLGQIYEVAAETDKAVAVYEEALSQKPVEASQQAVKAEIQQRVADLKRRFFASAGFQVGLDNNFSSSDPSSEDQFNTLSADLSYLLVKKPKMQFSLGYQLQTSYYIRNQIFFSNSGFSAGWQQVFSPRVTGNLRARSQLSFVKDNGLTSALSEETVSISYFGRSFPSVGSLQYSFLGVSYADDSSQNTLQHQGTATVSQRIFNKYTVDGGYVFTLQHRAASPDNEYVGHQVNVRVQWPIRDDLTGNGSVSESLQQFLNGDSRDPQNRKRRNTLLSYGVGLVKRLTGSTALSADVQVQRNDSNLGTAPPADALDILLNRNPSLGTYQKRVITVGINHSF